MDSEDDTDEVAAILEDQQVNAVLFYCHHSSDAATHDTRAAAKWQREPARESVTWYVSIDCLRIINGYKVQSTKHHTLRNHP